MRPKTVTVTSSNTPYYIPLDYRGGDVGVVASPSGAGNYTVELTCAPIGEGAAGVPEGSWVALVGMDAATTDAADNDKSATCLRVTLHSGTSVTVDVAQSDV